MRKRVTLAQIAEKAKVHQTTVSLALRNHPRISSTTTARIKAIAEEMNYRPDPSLSALVAYRKNVASISSTASLAYITGWETKWGWKNAPAHLQFYQGALDSADRLGYRLDHFWLGEKHLTHRRLNDILLARGINGIVVASQTPEDELKLDWDRFSAVKIDTFPRNAPLHAITNDQRTIIQLAYERVHQAGYRRIAFVMPYWWNRYVDLAWTAGYLAIQNELSPMARLPVFAYEAPVPESRDLSASEIPPDLLRNWLDEHRPDAIISYKPFVWPSLKKLGLRVPADIAYADIFPESTDGNIAGVINNCQRVGSLAIEILVGQILQNQSGLPVIPTATNVEGTWIDGATLPPARKKATKARSPRR